MQKTACEMRIRYWRSGVCSSYLAANPICGKKAGMKGCPGDRRRAEPPGAAGSDGSAATSGNSKMLQVRTGATERWAVNHVVVIHSGRFRYYGTKIFPL